MSVSELEQIWDDEKGCFSETYSSGQWTKVLEDVKRELQQCDAPQAVQAVHFADILLQNQEIGKVMDSMANGIVLRDRYMADNVYWALDQEAARGNHRIFVSAHNGHIEKRHEYGTSGKAMGNLLDNELGEGYFAIGTDFFKARVSLPKGESHINRSNHTFYSYNPLAKASKKCGYGMSWLDFSSIPDDSPLKQMVTGYLWMGSVGECYSPFMAIMPMAYRVWGSPAELYDGMIFVSKAQPIVVRKAVLE